MTVYDELPYDSRPIPGTSPGRLALCSLLHGGPRPPVRGYRVLEIGSNSGRNLLPMAFYDRDASFVGVDNARSALAAGRAAAADLGLRNLRLEWLDLHAAEPLEETFHYILIHGVFSWVDATARQSILRICAEHLAPDGVVYLSHNVDAGWRIRGLVRDVVMAASAALPTAAGRNRRAREVAAELHGVVDESDIPYHRLLAEELLRVANSTESYLAHETLSPENTAFRHDEIVSMLAEHGFSYLADALYDRPEGRAPDLLKDALGQLGRGGAEFERLADVLGYRRFRSSVFCRADARRADADLDAAIDGMFVAGSSGEPGEDDPPIDADFALPRDAQLATALLLLATEWPGGMRVSDLISGSSRLIDSAPMSEAEIRRRLLAMHMRGRVELSLIAPPLRKPGEGGVPHRLARYEAANAQDLTTSSHWPIGLDPIDRAIIGLLGERRGVDGTVEELTRRLAAGELPVPAADDDDAGHGDPEATLRAAVLEMLDTLGRWGLLE